MRHMYLDHTQEIYLRVGELFGVTYASLIPIKSHGLIRQTSFITNGSVYTNPKYYIGSLITNNGTFHSKIWMPITMLDIPVNTFEAADFVEEFVENKSRSTTKGSLEIQYKILKTMLMKANNKEEAENLYLNIVWYMDNVFIKRQKEKLKDLPF